MKTVIVIVDGAGDYPVPELGGRTPLEVAFTPNMNLLAQRGQSLLVDAVFDDLPVGSIVAALGILGYEPHRYFPNGRASFEAAASGIRLGPRDVAFRCNLISLEGDRIKDFTAGLISDARARSLVLAYPTASLGSGLELFPGQSYRNTLVFRDLGVPASRFHCSPPHENRGRSIEDLWVRARSPEAEQAVVVLNRFLRQSRVALPALSRRFDAQANMFWLWDPSDAPSMPSFHSIYGVNGAVVSGLSFLRGIGMAAQMLAGEVAGATGYLDSNLRGKASAAMELLEDCDVVVVHINAADEEAHQRNLAGKLKALELADADVVGPLVRHLRERYPEAFRICVLPDHYTCVADGHHIVHPVPCLIYGVGIEPDPSQSFGEREAAQHGSGRIKAWELMPRLRLALPS